MSRDDNKFETSQTTQENTSWTSLHEAPQSSGPFNTVKKAQRVFMIQCEISERTNHRQD